MADEKQTASDLDDWLDDLSDPNELSGELDQENIDALLGGGPGFGDAGAQQGQAAKDENAPAELDQDNIDALLRGDLNFENTAPEQAKTEGGADDAGVLDQDNIDALLNGGLDLKNDESEPAKSADALDQDNIDALLRGSLDLEDTAPAGEEKTAGGDDDAGELDQANIDALLRGSLDLEDAAPAGEEKTADGNDAVGLEQANIDALLSGPDAGNDKVNAAAETGEEKGGAAASRNSIDLVLGGGNGETDLQLPAAEELELDQDNIDALLRGTDKNSTASGMVTKAGGQTGTNEVLDVDQDEIDQLFSGLDDEIDEPFPSESMEPADAPVTKDDFLKVEAPAAGMTSAGEATVAAAAEAMPAEAAALKPGKNALTFMSGAFMRISAAVIVVSLLLFAGASFYFFRSGEKKKPAIPPPAAEQAAHVAETPPPKAPPNSLPVVSDSVYSMPEGGGEVAVSLTAKDEDNDPVTFDVTAQPLHGRLSGKAPSLIYLPNTDFPGEDRFTFKADDGKGSSCPATVTITGPNLAQLAADKQKAEAEKKAVKPARPSVLAKNITYDTTNTAEVTIEWGHIWREANRMPYRTGISVDIDASRLHGTLIKVNEDRYRYRPDPSFVGKDIIAYRFKRDGQSSRPGKLTMRVREGNVAPEIRIREMAESYMVGQTVLVDASATRDEARQSLTFNWEQIAGVPVQMKKNNTEGSIITFAMPSFFYTETEPGPVLRVTVIDAAGKSATREIKVRSISRRKSPLWGGTGGSLPRNGRLL